MSQLTKNTTDLDALIAKAQALPDAGSGGGTVETCTVTIDNPLELYWTIYYSCLVDGKVELVSNTLYYGQNTLENVIKNSYITVSISSMAGAISDSTFTGGVSVVETSNTTYMGMCMSIWKVTGDGAVVAG